MGVWALGVVINLVGSISINAGTNVLKLSLNLKKERIGYLGMYYFVVGSLLNFCSFGMAAQSLLAALGGVQFVANCCFGVIILNEKLTGMHLCACTILAIGVALVVAFADHETKTFTLQDIKNFYDNSWFVFCIAELGAVFVAEAVHQLYLRDTARKLPLHHVVNPLTYSFVSACLGTQSVLQSKCIAELIKTFLLSGCTDWGILVNLYVLLMVLAFVIFLGIWLHRLIRALSLYDGLVIIPILQVSWTLCAIIGGGLFFREFQEYTPLQMVAFLSGISLILVGVFTLAGSTSEKRILNGGPDIPKIEDTAPETPEHSGLSMSLQPQLCVQQVVPSPINYSRWLPTPVSSSSRTCL